MSRYIDADEVKKAIEESWDGCLGSYDSHEITMNDLWVIDKVQTTNVRENVHAHWVYKALEGFPEITFPVCSNCDEDAIDYVESNFCPHCGAVMDERREG